MHDQFTEIRDLFLAALERTGVDAQLQYAKEQCAAQPQVHAKLVDMLKAHHQEAGFLASGVDATHNMPACTESPGTRFGPYKVRELLGEGGMGNVYVAEQEEPVRRKVALKIIKPGMDSQQVIARFEAERHVLALMDHPHIARVLDAGTTKAGRPYFVMELVRGVPMTEFCDKRNLTTRERLELFVKVCLAVQHAHQKGILHRDIREHQAALADVERSREIFARLVIDYPDDPSYQLGLAKSHTNRGAILDDQGDQVAAVLEFQATVRLLTPFADQLPDQPECNRDLATAHHNLAVVNGKQQKLSEAEVEVRQAISIIEALVAAEPRSAEYRSDLARSRDKLGELLFRLDRLPEVESELLAALAIREELATEFPDRLEYRRGPQGIHQNLGAYYSGLGNQARAEAEFRAGLAIHESLIADFPHIQALRSGLTDLHHNLVAVLRMQGKLAEAEEQYRAFAIFQESQVAEYPHLPVYRQRLLDTHSEIGLIKLNQQKFSEAETEYLAAVKIGEALVELFPRHSDHGEYRLALARSHRSLGEVFMKWGKTREARAANDRSLSLCQALVDDFPSVPQYRRELAQVHIQQGLVVGDEGELIEQAALFDQAQKSLEQLATEFPDSLEFATDLGGNLCNIGQGLCRNQRPADALDWFGRAVEVLESVLHKNARSEVTRDYLANTHISRASALADLGRWPEAFKDSDRTLELAAELPEASLFQYEAAKLYARASGHETVAEPREAAALRAMELLREASKAGHFQSPEAAEELKSDSDFEPLRSRQDYLQFVQELK